MSAKTLNPLAVMDRLVREVPMGCGHIKALTEARATVAEAVEKAKDACNVLELAIGNGAFGSESTDEADSADEAASVAGSLRATLAKFKDA